RAHAAVTNPTVGARPTPTSTATPTAAPISTLRRGPMRSAPDPTRRAVASPATPADGGDQADAQHVAPPRRAQAGRPLGALVGARYAHDRQRRAHHGGHRE